MQPASPVLTTFASDDLTAKSLRKIASNCPPQKENARSRGRNATVQLVRCQTDIPTVYYYILKI